jgi:molybdopterin converting factor small subunit
MFVSVQFHGIQRRVTQTPEIQVPVLQDTRLKDVISYISDCYPDLSLSDGMIRVLVNDHTSPMNHILNPNDKITFLPPIGGG